MRILFSYVLMVVKPQITSYLTLKENYSFSQLTPVHNNSKIVRALPTSLLLVLITFIGDTSPTFSQPNTSPPFAQTRIASCQPPNAGEYLLLVVAPTNIDQQQLRNALPSEMKTVICKYLNETVVRLGGFNTIDDANRWARYVNNIVGLSAIITTLPKQPQTVKPTVISGSTTPKTPPSLVPSLTTTPSAKSSIVSTLESSEINTIAKKITVRIEGNTKEFGKIYGSGIIIKKQGNKYTVLTNWHVVQIPGNYNLYTNDNQKYAITNKKQLGELDLAIVEFNSSLNYSPANIGNSRQLTQTTPVYAAGFAAPDAICVEPCYRFLEGKIDAVLTRYKDGYALIYSNNIAPGMSGGPVLNQDGFLVGINGRASISGDITSYAAIPIHEYQKFDNVASQPAPKPTPKPVENSDPILIIPDDSNVSIKADFLGSDWLGWFEARTSPSPRNDNNISTAPVNKGDFYLANTLTDHSEDVSSLAINPDGRILASGSDDNSIKIWNLATGELIRTLYGHSSGVLSVAISPDGRTLVSGSLDDTIKVWNLVTGELILTLSDHYSDVVSVAISPDGRTLASGSDDNSIKIWNIATGEIIRTLYGHSHFVWSVAISPDGKTLASGSGDDTIKIWNLATGKLIRTLSGHSNFVNSVAISPDGRTLASGSWDNNIKIWNMATGKLIQTLFGHSYDVVSVAISPDGKTLASGSRDNIKIWNLVTGEQIRTLSGHSDSVMSVAWSPDGRTLVSGSDDNTIKIWRLSGH